MLKDKDITVAVGALGASIHLIGDKVSRFNGNSQYLALIRALCRCPSIKNVVIMSVLGKGSETVESWKKAIPEGWDKLIYPSYMVHRIAKEGLKWDQKVFYSLRKPDENGNREEIPYWGGRAFQDLYAQYCREKVPKIDFGLFFMTQGATATGVEGVIMRRQDPTQYRLQLPSARKCYAPFLHAINVLQFPWFMISTDERLTESMPRYECGVNFPLQVLGQWRHTIPWEVVESYAIPNVFVKKNLEVEYAQVEKLNLIDSQLVSPANDRPVKFSVVANQSTHRNDLTCQRFEQLKSWILDDPRGKDFNIYGEWSPAYLTGYKEDGTKEAHRELIEYNKKYNDYQDIPKEDIIYPQFKGRVDASVIDDVFRKTRYTVCFPVIPGYLTWKWLEALQAGCLPFIPPFYDEQFNAIPKDAVIRVKDPEELYFKIDYFEQNADKRIELVQFYQETCLKPCLDGSYLYPLLNSFLEKHHIDCRL